MSRLHLLLTQWPLTIHIEMLCPYLYTYVISICTSVRTRMAYSTYLHIPLTDVLHKKCPTQVLAFSSPELREHYMFILEYFSIFVLSLFSCVITSLLCCPTESKEKDANIWSLRHKAERENKTARALGLHRSHSESHILQRASRPHSCHWHAHKSRVISVPLRNETFSALSVMQKKKQVQQKRLTVESQSGMFLTSTLNGSPAQSVGTALFITAPHYSAVRGIGEKKK